MPEWSNGLAWKVSVPQKGTGGSNPPLSANEAMPPASESEQEFFAFRGCVETEGFQKRAKNAKNRPEGGGIAKVDSPPNGITESNPHSERFRLLNS